MHVDMKWKAIRDVSAVLIAFRRHQFVYKMEAPAKNEGQDRATGVNSSFTLNQRHFKEVIPSRHGQSTLM